MKAPSSPEEEAKSRMQRCAEITGQMSKGAGKWLLKKEFHLVNKHEVSFS
jgi:hypothetical protein